VDATRVLMGGLVEDWKVSVIGRPTLPGTSVDSAVYVANMATFSELLTTAQPGLKMKFVRDKVTASVV
jgi:hypothetical protein